MYFKINLICLFDVQVTFLIIIISVENSCVPWYFVETVFFKDSLIYSHFNSIIRIFYNIENVFVVSYYSYHLSIYLSIYLSICVYIFKYTHTFRGKKRDEWNPFS